MTTGVAALVVGAGCRRPARTQPPPAPDPGAGEQYCWHAVFSTALPPDTVAVHFARAFTALGLTGAAWSRLADTAWAQAGPTVLGGPRGGGTYAARVVAFRRGDTTLFRHFATTTPPPRGWPLVPNGVRPAAFGIGFCGDLGVAAAVHGTAPQWPNGEETLPVWSRRAERRP